MSLSLLQTCAGLRNFFIAKNSFELSAAYHTLIDSTPSVNQFQENWEKIEFEFNRLFVGPKAVLAPPYASVYLDSEALVMRSSTIKIRNFYEVLGLSCPVEVGMPDDHVSYELDAAWMMLKGMQDNDSEELKRLWSYFCEHLQAWMPVFASRIREVPGVSEPIAMVADLLVNWLSDIRKTLKKDGDDGNMD